MALFVNDFSRKLSWAEEHIEKLEASVAEFGKREPYRARKLTEHNKADRWFLEFTDQSDPSWALMIGDILYNLRCSLDYLAGALNPSSERSHVMFPVMREKIWEIPFVEGENEARTDARDKWNVCTRKMRPEAVAHIQELQPTDAAAYEPYFHPLDLLNRLSNKDRHRELHVQISGFIPNTLEFWMDEGNGQCTLWSAENEELPTPLGAGVSAVRENTEIHLPPGINVAAVVKVQPHGAMTHAIKMGDDGRHVIVPDTFRQTLTWIRDRAVVPLSPYLHGL